MLILPKLPGQDIFDKYCCASTTDEKYYIIVCNEQIKWFDKQSLYKMGWKNVDMTWFLEFIYL